MSINVDLQTVIDYLTLVSDKLEETYPRLSELAIEQRTRLLDTLQLLDRWKKEHEAQVEKIKQQGYEINLLKDVYMDLLLEKKHNGV